MTGDGRRSALLVLILLVVSACSLVAAHASRTLQDETGRKVTVPDHPHRVICLVPSVTDAVFALGSGDDVVAVSDYTTYPPEALKKPSIGSLVNPSIETILSFHPDWTGNLYAVVDVVDLVFLNCGQTAPSGPVL